MLENHSPLLEEEEEGVVGQQPIGQQPIKAEVSDLEGEDETLGFNFFIYNNNRNNNNNDNHDHRKCTHIFL